MLSVELQSKSTRYKFKNKPPQKVVLVFVVVVEDWEFLFDLLIISDVVFGTFNEFNLNLTY